LLNPKTPKMALLNPDRATSGMPFSWPWSPPLPCIYGISSGVHLFGGQPRHPEQQVYKTAALPLS
jgi:hypothetical protein